MKKLGLSIYAWICILFIPLIVSAKDVGWNASVGVNVGSGHSAQQKPPKTGYPARPQPSQPNPPYFKPRPPQNGVNFTYQAPSYNNYSQHTYMWVNGDSNASQIKRSEYILITNWRELGLPDPPQGMHWIYENGRYILQNN